MTADKHIGKLRSPGAGRQTGANANAQSHYIQQVKNPVGDIKDNGLHDSRKTHGQRLLYTFLL
jgi:hypothetical protein